MSRNQNQFLMEVKQEVIARHNIETEKYLISDTIRRSIKLDPSTLVIGTEWHVPVDITLRERNSYDSGLKACLMRIVVSEGCYSNDGNLHILNISERPRVRKYEQRFEVYFIEAKESEDHEEIKEVIHPCLSVKLAGESLSFLDDYRICNYED